MSNERFYSRYSRNKSEKSKEQWLAQAHAHYKSAHYEAAISACNQALRLSPTYDRAYHGKGLALFMLAQYEEALLVLNEATKLNPKNGKAYLCKGNVLSKLERYNLALEAYDKALQFLPNSQEALVAQGNIHFLLDKYNEALASYDKALQIDPKNDEAIRAKTAIVNQSSNLTAKEAIDQGLLNTDISIENLLVEDLPVKYDLPDSYIIEGDSMLQSNQEEEALIAYEKALQIDPNNRKALSGKGKALRLLGRYKEASLAFQAAKGIVARLLPYSETHEDKRYSSSRFRNYDDYY